MERLENFFFFLTILRSVIRGVLTLKKNSQSLINKTIFLKIYLLMIIKCKKKENFINILKIKHSLKCIIVNHAFMILHNFLGKNFFLFSLRLSRNYYHYYYFHLLSRRCVLCLSVCFQHLLQSFTRSLKNICLNMGDASCFITT